MKKIRLNWLVGLASMWVATTALGEETIKVALNIPLSGPFANIGELYVNVTLQVSKHWKECYKKAR